MLGRSFVFSHWIARSLPAVLGGFFQQLLSRVLARAVELKSSVREFTARYRATSKSAFDPSGQYLVGITITALFAE
jgi:hypothetical protein